MIIGAGPAGLVAAQKVAGEGHSVLVLEKESDLGAKACAEAIAESDFLAGGIPASSGYVANTIEGAFVYPQEEDQFTKIMGKGYMLDKPRFLHALAGKAISQDAGLLMNCQAIEIIMEGERALAVRYQHEGEEMQASFRILIGADGTGSVTSRSCRFDRSGYQVIPAVQYVMDGCNIPESRMLRLYFGDDVAPKGYAWIFPKSERRANVGIGTLGPPARHCLDRFIRNHPAMLGGASIVKEAGSMVPVGGCIQAVRGNVMLCGDSAGQIVPVTGAGIGTALVAGSTAGEAAVKALRANDISLLTGYPRSYAVAESRIHGDFNMLGGLISI